MNGNLTVNSLRVPITVTLKTEVSARNITREVSDVSFRSTIPGGFATCTVELNRPFADYSDELEQFAMLRLTDARSGSVVWEGRLEDPGRTASESGQVWNLSALGPATHAQDYVAPYVAIESSTANWVAAPGNPKWTSGSPQQINDITGAAFFEGFQITLETGINLVPDPFPHLLASYMYPVLAQSGQTLATVYGSFLNGRLVDANHHVRLAAAVDENVTNPRYISDIYEIPFAAQGASNGIPNGPNTQPVMFPTNFYWRQGVEWITATALEAVPVFQWIRRDNSNQTSGSQHWLGFGGPVFIRPVMHDEFGNSIGRGVVLDPSLFSPNYATSSQVFKDLMGTRLPLFDPYTSTIEPGTDGLITQFSYPDPTSTAQLLDDLVQLEGGRYYWAGWESYRSALAGVTKYRARAEWKVWPSEVKHVIGMEDGCDLPTSTEQVYDSVSVRWTDPAGRTRNTTVTVTNELLDRAGLHRRGTVDAGDNIVVDLAGAFDFGNKWLADHAYPRGTGTLTVAREILDRQTGRLLAPWELRPGCLVQISGANPSANAQGATSRNGRNVFRVVSTEFNSASGTATLELDSPANSIWDQIATANRNLDQRRRR